MTEDKRKINIAREFIMPIMLASIAALGSIYANRGTLSAAADEASTAQAELKKTTTAIDKLSNDLADKVNAVSVPVGTITAYACPMSDHLRDTLRAQGWLVCDGKVVSRNDYPELGRFVDSAWGSGSGAETFHLPDLRGVFLRGVIRERDENAFARQGFTNRERFNHAPEKDDLVGTYQRDGLKRHKHGIEHAVIARGDQKIASSKYHLFSWPAVTETMDNTDGVDETRPVNAFVYYLIKAK